MPGGILFGVMVGAVLSVCIAMAFAKLCEEGIIPEKRLLLTTLISLFAAVFVSTMSAGLRVKKLKFQTALCVGGVELLVCVLLHTLFLQGQFYHMIYLSMVFAVATVAGGLLAVKKKQKRKFA